MINALDNLNDDKIRNTKLCQRRKQQKFIFRWIFEIIILAILLFLKFAKVDGIVTTKILMITMIAIVVVKGIIHILQESDWDVLTIKGKSVHPDFLKKAKTKLDLENIASVVEVIILIIIFLSFVDISDLEKSSQVNNDNIENNVMDETVKEQGARNEIEPNNSNEDMNLQAENTSDDLTPNNDIIQQEIIDVTDYYNINASSELEGYTIDNLIDKDISTA